jgi:hypothetical protein
MPSASALIQPVESILPSLRGTEVLDSAAWPKMVDLWASYNRYLAHAIRHLPDAKLEVVCRIGSNAPVSLRYLAEDYVVHLVHHMDQIGVAMGSRRRSQRLHMTTPTRVAGDREHAYEFELVTVRLVKVHRRGRHPGQHCRLIRRVACKIARRNPGHLQPRERFEQVDLALGEHACQFQS